MNIVGGPYLGGNYWSDYTGSDTDGDGLGDTPLPYNTGISSDGDYHPLVPEGFEPLLSIEKTDAPDPVPPGGTLNYSISVNNTGNATATNVTVAETYDENVTFVGAVPAPPLGNDTWVFATLNVSETKWINISVSVNASVLNGTVLHNFVNVTCDEGVMDSDTADTTVLFKELNCTCGDICVNTTGWWRDGGAFNPSNTPIQAAVDNATAGETICVKDGIYNENVNVNKRLTIRSENGSASTIVNASNPNDCVFDVTVDYVNISGLTVQNATGTEKAGILLSNNVDHCNISNNNASNNYYGIWLYGSSNNNLRNNTANSNQNGIYLSSSSNNNLTSNTANSNDNYGIVLAAKSNNNPLTSNTANSNNNDYGIWLSSYNNIIYNNYFNNTNNAWDGGNNVWNTTKTAGTNIIGGPYLGGNYWSDYAGKDTDGDGLGDTLLPYSSSGNIQTGGDWHPLVQVGFAPPNITSFAPPSPVNDTVCTWRTFNVTVNQEVNVSWYLNGSLLHTNESIREANYTLHAEFVGDNNVSAVASNANGTDMQTWIWNVTAGPAPAPPNITAFAPPSPVNDTVCNWRTFNVTVNQTVNVSWYLNITLQHTNVSTKEANYTLHAEVVGEHNVSAIASNENGTDMQTWVWNVTAAPLPVLEINKTDNPDPVSPGGTLNYSIRVNNTGNATVTNVIVTETYDENVTFLDAVPAPSQGSGTWVFATLNVGEMKWINISVTVNASVLNETVLHNFVNVTCDEGVTDSDTEDTTVLSLPVCIKTATGTGIACFETDAGTIEDLVAVDEATLPEEGKPALAFPHGFFSFNITGLTAGQTVVVTVTLPDNVPVGTQY